MIDPCKRYRDSDTQFYEALRLEKHDAFSCLYRQCHQQCIPYAVARGSNQEQAEDLLQECLAIFVSKIRDGSYVFQEGTRITTYFHRIFINQWKKSLEQTKRRAEVHIELDQATSREEDDFRAGRQPGEQIDRTGDSDTADGKFLMHLPEADLEPYGDEERGWIFKKLDRAFGLLAEDCRKMLHWFYVDDRSLRDIAQELAITEAYAAVKRFKCAKYLKEKFHLK